MWWVKDNPDHSRGGFQNRDVGRTNFGADFGNDYGIDYARFTDPPDLFADSKLLDAIKVRLFTAVGNDSIHVDILVRNGFVILRGTVLDEAVKCRILKEVFLVKGVKEVINDLNMS